MEMTAQRELFGKLMFALVASITLFTVWVTTRDTKVLEYELLVQRMVDAKLIELQAAGTVSEQEKQIASYAGYLLWEQSRNIYESMSPQQREQWSKQSYYAKFQPSLPRPSKPARPADLTDEEILLRFEEVRAKIIDQLKQETRVPTRKA